MGRGRAGAWVPSLARTSLVRLSVDSRAVVVLGLVLGDGGTGVVPRAERRVERRLVVSEEEEAGAEGLVGVVLLLLLAVEVSVVPAIFAGACKIGEGEKGRRKSEVKSFWHRLRKRENSYASKSSQSAREELFFLEHRRE